MVIAIIITNCSIFVSIIRIWDTIYYSFQDVKVLCVLFIDYLGAAYD